MYITKLLQNICRVECVFKLIYSSTHLHNGLEEYVYI